MITTMKKAKEYLIETNQENQVFFIRGEAVTLENIKKQDKKVKERFIDRVRELSTREAKMLYEKEIDDKFASLKAKGFKLEKLSCGSCIFWKNKNNQTVNESGEIIEARHYCDTQRILKDIKADKRNF